MNNISNAMDYFLTNIKVKKLLHLQDFDIPLSEKEKKHLVITGRNGSGKTILLNAILECLEGIRVYPILSKHIDTTKTALSFNRLD
ncbi:MAG: ABC transporter ATP-binding protein, partial [Tannerellaceae bacterium]|nr:ABC transporter ATP-binding protein [Tannerellaceae bacterium]